MLASSVLLQCLSPRSISLLEAYHRHTMGFALLQGAFLVCAAWMVWAVARKLVAKSTLANVPGPRPRTYNLFGTHRCRTRLDSQILTDVMQGTCSISSVDTLGLSMRRYGVNSTEWRESTASMGYAMCLLCHWRILCSPRWCRNRCSTCMIPKPYITS